MERQNNCYMQNYYPHRAGKASKMVDYADKAADILAKWRAGIFTTKQKNEMVAKLNREYK